MPRRPHMSKCISEAAGRAGMSVAEACTQAGMHRADAHHGSMSAEGARRLAEGLGDEGREVSTSSVQRAPGSDGFFCGG